MDKIKLNKYRSMLSTNQDSFMGLDLVNTNRELPFGSLNKSIDLNDVYLDELNKSDKYRLSFTINGVFTNILTNLTGNDSLATFNDSIFKSVNSPLNQQGLSQKTDISYKESVEMHLRVENGWVGYYKPNGLSVDCKLIELNPKKKDLYFVNTEKKANWDLGLYYLKGKKQAFLGHTGLPITHCDTVDYAGRTMYRFFTPFNHNLQIGETVYVSNIGSSSGKYTVIDLGDDNNENKEMMFVLDLPIAPNITQNSNMKRVVNGVESEYYLRTLGLLTDIYGNELNQKSFDMSQLGFATNIYGDSLTQVIYNKDVDLSMFKDYRQRQPLEIILGVIKKAELLKFVELQSGYNLKYHNYFGTHIEDVRRLDGIKTPLENNITFNQSNGLIYDFVEFNSFELKEYQICDIYHRFNLHNRVGLLNIINESSGLISTSTNLGTRREGYLYKPFYPIIVREESEYVEKGTDADIIPEYAYEYSPFKYAWRDIYDKTSSSITYPFLNGCHYIQKNFDFLLMRQDPFGNYGLLYRQFPKDQVGKPNRLKPQFIQINNKYDEC